MRVSVIKDDSGYANLMVARANGKSVSVYLDGIEQPDAITADEEKGLVLCDVLGDDGMPKLDELGENFMREIKKGAVEIKIQPAADA